MEHVELSLLSVLALKNIAFLKVPDPKLTQTLLGFSVKRGRI